MKRLKTLLGLFWDFFRVGLFTFGGGYAMISVISSELVDKRGYVSQKEFSDIVAIAESTPGPIAINSATYIGYRVCGVLGSLVASLAVSLPSFIIIYLISVLLPNFLDNKYVVRAFKGVQCAVVVLIIAAGIKLIKNLPAAPVPIILTCLSAAALITLDVLSVSFSTIYFVLIGGGVGFAIYYPKVLKEKKRRKAATQIDQTALIDEADETPNGDEKVAAERDYSAICDNDEQKSSDAQATCPKEKTESEEEDGQ